MLHGTKEQRCAGGKRAPAEEGRGFIAGKHMAQLSPTIP